MNNVYGNLCNRFEEGKMYCDKIEKGTDITMYYWSDRRCYYVDEVINGTEIKVRPYYVCADHSKEGGLGHQNWAYFKTRNEESKYLQSFGLNGYELSEEPEAETWELRNKEWKRKTVITKEDLKTHSNYWITSKLTEKQLEKLENGGTVVKYIRLPGKISFGTKDYYYDWEF